ncbi:MAG: dNTP triphosphohydrolase [Candidatus Sumerlaeota bacterium]|nr:dNTP triphosphohydrolase [Candidatus Sumerlaeota bacterium]
MLMYRSQDKRRVLELVGQKYSADPASPFERDCASLTSSAAFRRLQGKTQLFPLGESDSFRNRLTHSFEVAQIAKRIARFLNASQDYLQKGISVDLDLVELAALAHDLGHPPFGHNGERALNECMQGYGGFESNAQTLRILARLAKKEKLEPDEGKLENSPLQVIVSGLDKRVGLNLTYRALAAILKYDARIPKGIKSREARKIKLVKGYYQTEVELVRAIKSHVAGSGYGGKFKTIECEIMDIADDIAYATYDLEDALKAEFLSPLSILTSLDDDVLIKRIADKVGEALGIRGYSSDRVGKIIHEIFGAIFEEPVLEFLNGAAHSNAEETKAWLKLLAVSVYQTSHKLCASGYRRASFVSELIDNYVNGIESSINKKIPALSSVSLNPMIKEKVEILKNYVYEALVMSERVKIAEHRGKKIIRDIFDTLDSPKGHLLLPKDFREQYEAFSGDDLLQKRVICDFIANMTDRYANEFYARLMSEEHVSIFKSP